MTAHPCQGPVVSHLAGSGSIRDVMWWGVAVSSHSAMSVTGTPLDSPAGDDRGEPLTSAEVAARQAEAADALILGEGSTGTTRSDQAASAPLRHLNARAVSGVGAGGRPPNSPAAVSEVSNGGT
ncbi:hypothetical protein ACGFYQ_32230 [Streptomyces sp. NPDC048258]|uniref:hypothetical protein n=1 Tax=Streptomyces sp. NPDC048258 TaxID=3365527 RepID=UPI003716FCC3